MIEKEKRNLNKFIKKIVKMKKNFRIDGKFKIPCKLIDGTIEENFILHLFSFRSKNKFIPQEEHFHVIDLGDVKNKEDVLVRIESACTYAHLYGSKLCDCQYQMQQGLKRISDKGSGIYIYCLDQHGRGTGTVHHVTAYKTEHR